MSMHASWLRPPIDAALRRFASRNMRQLRVLHREFLFRIVDRELLSTHAQGDTSKLLLQVAALLIFVSLLFAGSVRELENAPLQQVRILLGVLNSHRLIAATMLVVGLLAVLSWQSMFPDRLDVQVLAPLPVRPKTLLIAKVAAMVTALLVAVCALNLAAGVAWPFGLNIEAPAQTIPALTSDRPLPPVGVADLQAVMDRDLAEAQRSGLLAPGMGGGIAIGVSQRGERRVFAYGASNADSLFETGSVTKTFTGVLLAHMTGAHQVRINEPVRELLPELGIAKPERAEISLLDLATHRSGMRGMDQSYRPPDPDNPLADYDKERLYIFLRSRGLVKWDSMFRYNNIGFGLLGHALATRAGTDYVPLVRKVITGPLSMHDTVFTLNEEQKRRFMQPYRVQRGPRHPVRPFDVDVLAGAAGFRSTAGDMLTWAEANLHPDRLSPGVGAGRSALAAALTASHEPRKGDGPGRPMGLAWFLDPATGSYWHGGATPGSTAQVWFSPREDMAIVVLSNTGPGSAFSAEIVSEHIRARLTGKAPIAIADVTVPAAGGLPRLLRFAAAWWLAMIAAGTFIFGLVMALQGLAMQLLPRRTFLRASSFLQLGAFAVIVSVYCLQSAARPPALVAAQLPMIDGGSLLAWSPSFWFLGLFQQLSGSPAFGILATRAWVALGLVLLATATAYGLSYYRTLRRIAEEPVIPPRPRAIRAAVWLPSFGQGLPAAVVQFSVRTLLRSPQHRVILAFYLGMGFAATIFFLNLPQAREIAEQASAATISAAPLEYPWHEVSGWMIASSVLMMVFSAIGTRLAFALPLDLRANWIFRTTPPHDAREYLAARRRAMLAIGVLPVWTVMAVLLLSVWPWRAAIGHLIVLGLLGAIFAEVGLRGAQKIPFTCSYLPGKSSFHVAFWVFLLIAVPVVMWASSFERDVLNDPIRYVVMLAALAVILLAARLWTRRVVTSAEGQPRFEEEASDQVVALNVWDGLRNLPRNGQKDGQKERGGRSAIPSPSNLPVRSPFTNGGGV